MIPGKNGENVSLNYGLSLGKLFATNKLCNAQYFRSSLLVLNTYLYLVGLKLSRISTNSYNQYFCIGSNSSSKASNIQKIVTTKCSVRCFRMFSSTTLKKCSLVNKLHNYEIVIFVQVETILTVHLIQSFALLALIQNISIFLWFQSFSKLFPILKEFIEQHALFKKQIFEGGL